MKIQFYTVDLSSLLDAEINGWVATVALVISVTGVRALLARLIRNSRLPGETRRRWLVQVRTVAVLLLLFGVVAIWAQELRSMAFSLVAVAVAVTIGIKELLLCLSGALIRTSARAFHVGDRVQIGTYRGDVIDVGALTTKMLEVDDATNRRTGRAITVPNSMLLDRPAINETFAGSFVLSVLTVPLPGGADWQEEERFLLRAAQEECAPFLEDAKARISRASRQEVLDVPIVDPMVSLLMENAEEMKLQLRFPTSVRLSHRVAQLILKRYLDLRRSASRRKDRHEAQELGVLVEEER